MFKQYIFGYNNNHKIVDKYIFAHLRVSYKINKRLYLFDGISTGTQKFKISYLEPPDVVELKALLSFVAENCKSAEYVDGPDTYPGVLFQFTLNSLNNCAKRIVSVQLKQKFMNYLIQPTRQNLETAITSLVAYTYSSAPYQSAIHFRNRETV